MRQDLTLARPTLAKCPDLGRSAIVIRLGASSPPIGQALAERAHEAIVGTLGEQPEQARLYAYARALAEARRTAFAFARSVDRRHNGYMNGAKTLMQSERIEGWEFV
jgi:hypothetical protein